MNEYPKIQSIYKRGERGAFIEGEFSTPEFAYLADNEWTWTEKVDGTNIRVIYAGDPLDSRERRITFGGKTNNAQIPASLVEELQRAFLFPDLNYPGNPWFDTFGADDACLYGEGFGEKIQKGGGNYGPVNFVLFDVKVGDWWLRRADIEDVASKLGIGVVPIVGSDSLYTAVEQCRKGFDSTWGSFRAEGLVCKPECDLRSRRGERIITKVKCRDFSVR